MTYYSGEKLREALSKDRGYQKLLNKRKERLSKQLNVSLPEKKKYVLSTTADFEILNKCKQLEKLALMESDKQVVALIKSQLENDWRRPLLQTLNKLIKKYLK